MTSAVTSDTRPATKRKTVKMPRKRTVKRGDRLAIVVAATDAAEGDDRADIGAALAQDSDFLRDVEIGFLDANGRRDGHGVIFFLTRFLPQISFTQSAQA